MHAMNQTKFKHTQSTRLNADAKTGCVKYSYVHKLRQPCAPASSDLCTNFVNQEQTFMLKSSDLEPSASDTNAGFSAATCEPCTWASAASSARVCTARSAARCKINQTQMRGHLTEWPPSCCARYNKTYGEERERYCERHTRATASQDAILHAADQAPTISYLYAF
eukprot:1221538-Pleurochrysis_carterae.AAC.3